jgi:enamine deaminase RidA (YjgF/YER057c/UK114 family)
MTNPLTPDQRLAELGITLPEPAAPVASYAPAVEIGGFLYISGQISLFNGQLMTGKVGDTRSEEEGVLAAHACGLMLIAQMQKALGSLDRVERIVKLGAFIACTPDYSGQPKIANGASDLMEAVFGEAGKHARSAVGVPVLPLDATVEIDAVVKIRD